MINGYYSATGGMITQFNRLDVISNNLANLNTNGFKRDDVVIGDFLRLYKQTQDTLPLKDHTRAAAQYQNRNLNRVPIISEEYTEFASGAIAQTENPLDFALQKPNAYFAIQTPDGVRYTRDGSFTIDNEGYLSTKQGFRVLSRVGIDGEGPNAYFAIQTPDGVRYTRDGSFTIDNEGYLSTKQGFRVLSRVGIDGEGGIIIGQGMQVEADKNGNLFFRSGANEEQNAPVDGGALAIVSFDNPKYLQKVGDNLYSYPQERIEDRVMSINDGSLAQGFIEKSNVNAIKEMTALIETNRLVDMYSKAMRTFVDDFAPEAIGKLAVRA